MKNQALQHLGFILEKYGLGPAAFSVETVGSGYIHDTFLLSGERKYILQRVNKNVFRDPEAIASNLRHAGAFLQQHHPDYTFLRAVENKSGDTMTYDAESYPWRIFPFIEGTFTIDKVENASQAFSAASAFARLTRRLDGVNIQLFRETIPGFHNLSLRYQQFENALQNGVAERRNIAANEIEQLQRYRFLVDEYELLTSTGRLRQLITHNDTKINNVLFDRNTGEAVCAIDLDTLMPGFFLFDLGDMIRTFVSPVDEEEQDLSKVVVRPEIYAALINGYIEGMENTLTEEERDAIPFAGMMMIYIMALRMLADYLNGDVYYKIRYENQNLNRARNQIRLLQELDHFLSLRRT